MTLLRSSLAAAAALALFASAAQACEFHAMQQSMASTDPATASDQRLTPLPVVIEQAKADTATQTQCPTGVTDCAPVSQ